ncbi:ZIP family metal transporter [candidate division KSB1 bacterium]|nr:ZIP family metal transporter [candidate division KSB1 bacterium]
MATTFITYNFLIICISLLGGIIPLLRKWQPSTIRLFVSFGAGILLAVSFLHMIPLAAEYLGHSVGFPLLAGFLLLYIIEKFIMVHTCEAHDCHYHTLGWSAFIGLGVHSLTDGLVLGTGLAVPQLSLVVFLAIMLHKFPASFSLSSILLYENFSKRKIILLLGIFTLAVPVGGVITFSIVSGLNKTVIGWLIAFSAGTFLHVAADDLLPEVHSSESKRIPTLLTFVLGLCVIGLSSYVHH